MNAIELLSPELIRNKPELTALVTEAQETLNHPFGWHYLLDYIWILDRARTLPPGSLILDAGAGQGMLQVLLARMGHRVISTDFSPRVPRPIYAEHCSIVTAHSGDELDPDYVRHMYAAYPGRTPPPVRLAPDDITRLFAEEKADIVYYTADIGHMPQVPDHCLDAVVSISALEHNDHAGVRRAVAELERTLKPGAPMWITVSAARDQDWFHEPSKGWCFSEKSLVELFGLGEPESNFADYDRIFALLTEGEGLKERLAPFYFTSGNNGMPWGVWNPQYQPVGVARRLPPAA
jgi:ubiquinone/menaquinone biosynthesis C-methylase UbiE